MGARAELEQSLAAVPSLLLPRHWGAGGEAPKAHTHLRLPQSSWLGALQASTEDVQAGLAVNQVEAEDVACSNA